MRAAILISTLLGTAVPAGAAFIIAEPNTTIAPGQETRVAVFGSPRSDCSSNPRPEVRVLNAPNGSVRLSAQTLRTTRVTGCPSIEMPITTVSFTPSAGVSGQESITLEVRETDKPPRQLVLSVTVKP